MLCELSGEQLLPGNFCSLLFFESGRASLIQQNVFRINYPGSLGGLIRIDLF
jgi:hypothetical protein